VPFLVDWNHWLEVADNYSGGGINEYTGIAVGPYTRKP
jgi:hypothetical protein